MGWVGLRAHVGMGMGWDGSCCLPPGKVELRVRKYVQISFLTSNVHLSGWLCLLIFSFFQFFSFFSSFVSVCKES